MTLCPNVQPIFTHDYGSQLTLRTSGALSHWVHLRWTPTPILGGTQPAAHPAVSRDSAMLMFSRALLMFSTDFKEQWETAQTYGYGCVSCHAPRKPHADGVLHVPAAGRVMEHVRRDVLKAQQTGEYGTQFVKPYARCARLEVGHPLCAGASRAVK